MTVFNIYMSDKKDFQQRLQRIEELVGTIEASADPNVRTSAIELMQCLMDLNASGIERIMDIAYESSPNGGEIIDKIADDEMAESFCFYTVCIRSILNQG